MKKLVLASSSPRRIEMIKKNGYSPIIIPADIDESLPIDISFEASVMYLSLKKASCTSALIDYPALVIGADTVVVFDKKIIGKPTDKEDAYNILSKLRNNVHQVVSGVCVIDTETRTKLCLYDSTEVFFKNYSDNDLIEYVSTKEPYDKAGGYAIQGTFKKYISHINGDFNNVVGFPWYKVEPLINKLL